MNTPRIALIAAVARNGIIGRNNTLPWRLSEDLKRFKRLTTGKPVIMGRKTWESIGRPLPNRTNIVVTTQTGYTAEGCIVVHSLNEAITAAKEHGGEEIMIIGGAALYKEALTTADRIYLTRVEADVEGDAFFPEVDWNQWKERERETLPADDKNEYPTTFLVLER